MSDIQVKFSRPVYLDSFVEYDVIDIIVRRGQHRIDHPGHLSSKTLSSRVIFEPIFIFDGGFSYFKEKKMEIIYFVLF